MRNNVVIALLLAGSATLVAEWVTVDVRNVPVDRLVANLEQELKAKPRDVGVLINLARVYSMAFAEKRDTIPTGRMNAPWLGYGSPRHEQFEVRSATDAKAIAAARAHLDKAIARYREVLAIEGGNTIAMMGLGWALAQSGDREGAVKILRDVVTRAWPGDQKGGRGGDVVFHGYRYLTEEAARYLIPLLDPKTDTAEIADLRKKARTLEQQPRAVTPIAIPLEDGLAAAKIEDHTRTVAFDADGSALPKRWTWIRPNAAWLVFDRYDERRITSGLQLFGSVTFWLFWENGYDALRSLDDNGDGSIAGRELDGLSLWQDRNSNGVSEPGEVRPVAAWGVASLSCAYEHDPGHPDEIAFSAKGVTFQNGVVRPTFDLILRSQPPHNPGRPTTDPSARR